MMSEQDQGSGSSQQPPLPRGRSEVEYPPRDGKPVSFYLAIFLGLLLLVSGGLNLLLLVASAVGGATSGLAGYSEESDANYEVVAVGGDPDASDRLMRVPVVGAIAESETPVLGAAGGTVTQIKRALKTAGASESIRGVLLDIDSPGGGVTDSDEIWRLIDAFRREHGKPVLALFGDVAASGGYYIAAACDEIHARPTSLTGSIGVIMQSFNVAEAADKLGVSQETIVSPDTPHKDILSPFRPMTDDEREILGSIVQELYERFVDKVDAGRPKLTREQVEQLADGRIYSANQAVANGLVDGTATIDQAYARLEELCGIESARFVEHRRRPTLGELLFGIGASAPSLDSAAASLLRTTSGPRFLYFWAGAR